MFWMKLFTKFNPLTCLSFIYELINSIFFFQTVNFNISCDNLLTYLLTKTVPVHNYLLFYTAKGAQSAREAAWGERGDERENKHSVPDRADWGARLDGSAAHHRDERPQLQAQTGTGWGGRETQEGKRVMFTVKKIYINKK